jgi:hypothetical protein
MSEFKLIIVPFHAQETINNNKTLLLVHVELSGIRTGILLSDTQITDNVKAFFSPNDNCLYFDIDSGEKFRVIQFNLRLSTLIPANEIELCDKPRTPIERVKAFREYLKLVLASPSTYGKFN